MTQDSSRGSTNSSILTRGGGGGGKKDNINGISGSAVKSNQSSIISPQKSRAFKHISNSKAAHPSKFSPIKQNNL